ncbi:DNA polymerase III subunit gamma/tau [Metamycoplasma hyosynoviae]|uniref:DNA polymerase III subunit gamma/tau n=1 Tax=Metamycoplasma hyosynoviae TaxID=29559 RepID=UPI002358F697|nr:DNA polymerase III subunit gamma/tau [Metamycoplasma hyosynoviae]MDC8921293.1 DNA polymerase III subunit gamma/tau [Metamycoplasma hyosynoviae]
MEGKYKTLYRHYRPRKFNEVKGQDNIIVTLINVIKNRKISHAYLFCGPHGTGKTSVAKIFANTINCIHTNDILTPCDECIANIERNLDIIEIDAASNSGIDDIRDLKDKINHMPINSRYKIYIIDEVHMLSKAAFNALLKTIEEPPSHAIFILATTDPQKIPLTILSRVQRFNFKRIEKNIMIEHLREIFKKEGIKADPKSLDLIASLSEGSFRDALTISDQIAIFVGNRTITEKDVQNFFGILDKENLIKILNLIAAHNIKEFLNLNAKLISDGIDIEKMVVSLINLLKDYFIYIKTQDENLLEYASVEDLKKIDISKQKVSEFITELVKILEDIKMSDLPLQSLELGFIKLACLKTDDENFINTITSPISSVSKEDTNDFEIVNIHRSDTIEKKTTKETTKPKSNNNKINDFLGLGDIANKYDIKMKPVDVSEILNKTDEILIEEKTKEVDLGEMRDTLITNINEIPSPDPTPKQNKSNAKIDEEIQKLEAMIKANSGLITDELIYDCIYVSQKDRNIPNFIDYKNTDKMNFKLLNTKLKSEKENEARVLLQDLNLILSSKDFIVFSSNIAQIIKKLNENSYKEFLVNAAYKVFGRYVHLFAITKAQKQSAEDWWKKNKDKPRTIEKLPNLEKKFKKDKELDEFLDDFGDIYQK